MLNRRGFLLNSGALAMLAGATPVLAQGLAQPSSRKLAVQLWTVAKMLAEDFEGTIATLAGLGYNTLETYGPYAFSDQRNIESWNAVTPQLGFSGSGLFGNSVAEARAIFARHGMSVASLHTDIFSLQTRMGELAEAAHGLGATYVTLPSLPDTMRQSLDDYRRAADLFNAIGENAASHGVRFAYHNHGYGFSPIDGQVPIDLLLDGTSPAHVFLEMDTYWTQAGGADPKAYLARYAGRYRMMHLKDMQGEHRFAGDGGNASQWIELFPFMTHLGAGTVDIAGIIAAGEQAGVEHFFVEQDYAPDVLAALAGSAQFLKEHGFS